MPKTKRPRVKFNKYERPISSYDRRPGTRRPGRCMLIVCEGAETEPNYFKQLREYLKLSTVSVSIEPRGGAPISLIQKALNLMGLRDQEILEQKKRYGKSNIPKFEAIWCVFDVENPHHNQTFLGAVQKSDEYGFNLAVSNPAFEFWYILHFEHTTRPFTDGSEAKQHLCKHIHGYQEAMPVFSRLITLTTQAIRNAKRIFQDHSKGDSRFPNPSTRVYLLVEEMIEMSPSGREHFH